MVFLYFNYFDYFSIMTNNNQNMLSIILRYREDNINQIKLPTILSVHHDFLYTSLGKFTSGLLFELKYFEMKYTIGTVVLKAKR